MSLSVSHVRVSAQFKQSLTHPFSVELIDGFKNLLVFCVNQLGGHL